METAFNVHLARAEAMTPYALRLRSEMTDAGEWMADMNQIRRIPPGAAAIPSGTGSISPGDGEAAEAEGVGGGVPGAGSKLRKRSQLTTPCLIVELSALDANIALMADLCRRAGLDLRPHAKAHKCAEIGKRQIAAGASGLCVATVGEAERFADAGLNDFHLTSTVAGPDKLARLAALAGKGVLLSAVVDNREMVDAFSQAANAAGTKINLLVELDMGRHRAGAASVEEALDLARGIAGNRHLSFGGVQAYAGHMSHQNDYAQRRRAGDKAKAFIATVRDALTPMVDGRLRVTGGSTGSLFIDRDDKVLTELQCGSYIFMDVEYMAVDLDGKRSAPFGNSLFLETAVISNRIPGLVTTDGGDKRLAAKYGANPLIARGAPDGATYRASSDEHGEIKLPSGGTLPLNARIEVIVPHCDPTVNLADTLYAVHGDDVVAIWSVTARGV